ncbi:hypothetical protein [Streptomyces sp. NPDC000888]
MTEPVQRQQIGYDLAGNPMYSAPFAAHAAPVAQAPLQPLTAYPWGAYLGAGCFGLLALVVVAFALVAVLIGLSIALVVLAIGLIALVICLLVLRSMWRDYQRGR